VIYDAFVLRQTNSVRASATGSATPAITITLLAHLAVRAFFIGEDGAVAPLGGESSARCIVKASPTASTLLLDATMDLTGSGTAAHYLATWDDSAVDSDALRTLLGDALECPAYLEIEWTIDDLTERTAFPITLKNAFFRPGDTAPDPAADVADAWLTARALRFDLAQTLTTEQTIQALANIGITGIASATILRGCLSIIGSDDTEYHIPLTAGAPPAL